MKFILVGIILIGTAYIGYGLSHYYRKRKRFFEDIILFCDKLSVDISFSKEFLSSIISNNLQSFSNEFSQVLKVYLDYLKNNETSLNSENLFKKTSLIKNDEKETITLFLKSLGKLDASNQVAEINNFKTKFSSFKDFAEEENKKFGSLSLKLMILLGLLVVIILI